MNPVEGAIVPVVGAMKPVAGAMAPVVVAGAVAVEVEEEVAVEGETMDIVFCLLVALACVYVLKHVLNVCPVSRHMQCIKMYHVTPFIPSGLFRCGPCGWQEWQSQGVAAW